MKQRQMTLIAAACGVLCALCVAAFLWHVQGEADAARAEVLAKYGGEQVEVCVATRDVAAGERVDASAVETKLWVADLLPDGAINDSSTIVGKTATSSILKGEVVLEGRFAESQGALDIPLGQEAVSVPAKAVQAVGGAIRPGMSVDVYSLGGSGVSPLARDVLVLASSVGEGSSLVSSDTGWITLAVAPESVEEVIAASGKTTLYFVLPGATAEDVQKTAENQAAQNEKPSKSAESSNGDEASTASSVDSKPEATAKTDVNESSTAPAKEADTTENAQEDGE